MGNGPAKQYRHVAGKPLLLHSIEAFYACQDCREIILVVSDDARDEALQLTRDYPDLHFASGGDTRRQSVSNGLQILSDIPTAPELVFIHDAARPGLTQNVIDSLQMALEDADGALPALPVTDSLARADDRQLQDTVERERLYRVQTPQAFHLKPILSAHRNWRDGKEATDDARMVMAMGGKVAHVDGDERLMKITYADDIDRYEALTTKGAAMMRIGKGYDVHRLEEGEELWLCGIRIEHSHGLSGHSDADVAIHALCDAIFGALGEGDIGTHFPPSDEKWRGAASSQFLAEAMRMARAAGYRLANCDLTIICEVPKIGPHRQDMRRKLAEIMQVDERCVSVKATTTEGLGFAGRREGIAADAIVLLKQ